MHENQEAQAEFDQIFISFVIIMFRSNVQKLHVSPWSKTQDLTGTKVLEYSRFFKYKKLVHEKIVIFYLREFVC